MLYGVLRTQVVIVSVSETIQLIFKVVKTIRRFDDKSFSVRSAHDNCYLSESGFAHGVKRVRKARKLSGMHECAKSETLGAWRTSEQRVKAVLVYCERSDKQIQDRVRERGARV